MHLGDGPSWRVGIGDASDLAFALYVREAAAIVGAEDVPPLFAPVPRWSYPFSKVQRAVLATQWSSWWSTLLSKRTDGSVSGGYDGPDFTSMVGTQELRRVQREVFLPANRWRATSGLEPWSYTGDEAFMPIELVVEIEAGLGRTARPFSFSVEVLPIMGAWCWDLSPTQMLASEALCADSDAFCEVLRSRLTPLA